MTYVTRASIAISCHLLAAAAVYGQVGPPAANSIIPSFVTQLQVPVAAGSTPTLFSLPVDAPTTGREAIDVILGSPNVIISLILPGGGTEITASNASSNGFAFTTYTSDGTGTSDDFL